MALDMVKKTVKLTKDPSGTPAVDVSGLGDEHVDLKKRAAKAGLALNQLDLGGVRGQAVLILDHSGSMRSDYKSGAVQMLVERALGFALQIDVDGKIPVIPFDSQLYPTVEVDVSNYQGVVQREIWRNSSMGSTVMSAPLERLKAMSEASDEPIFAIVVGDGSPDRPDRPRTRKVAMELASYPIFVKFLTIRPVDFLQELDDATDRDRLLDNIDAQDVPDPAGISDLAFAQKMVEEWPGWIQKATAAGVLA